MNVGRVSIFLLVLIVVLPIINAHGGDADHEEIASGDDVQKFQFRLMDNIFNLHQDLKNYKAPYLEEKLLERGVFISQKDYQEAFDEFKKYSVKI